MPLDPVTQSILLGVASNALTTLLASMGKAGARLVKGKNQHVATNLLVNISLVQVEKLINDTKRLSRRDYSEFKEFLNSSSIGLIFRQVHAVNLAGGDIELLGRVKYELGMMIALYLGRDLSTLDKVVDDFFVLLLQASEEALKGTVGFNSPVSADSAEEALEIRRVFDEITNIERNIEFLEANPDLHSILDFEVKYLRQVRLLHAHIVPPNFDAIRKVPVDQIYVTPKLLMGFGKTAGLESIDFKSFSASFYRSVILGNPGGGKSTLVSKLAYDYSERSKGGGDRHRFTPILIVLRDYGSEKRRRSCSILEYMENLAKTKYQLSPPAGSFEYLLLSGSALVMFDGLDELLETSRRREISEDVEAFCNLYPAAPVLITSREVGYEQSPLDNKMFSSFRLGSFDNTQVSEYVDKWFGLSSDLDSGQRSKKSRSFMIESESVSDLRSNPLMLALMCNIYRGDGYIPKNRPDLYEKCALMLFERWDKGREIVVSLPFEAHVRPAMMYLAYNIYRKQELQGGVTETRLISEAADYLSERRFEDRDEALSAARAFVEFCRGRAWVFTDTGSTKEGEALYQFTHRTFLEYFAAAYIVRTHSSPAKLMQLLLPHISTREWDVVSQLSFQIQNKSVEGAGDLLLERLLTAPTGRRVFVRRNRLFFAGRCLQFMVPRPSVVRNITTCCVEEVIGATGVDRRNGVISPIEPIEQVLKAAEENRSVVADAVKLAVDQYLASEDMDVRLRAAEFIAMLPVASELDNREDHKFWADFSTEFVSQRRESILALSLRRQLIAHQLWLSGHISIDVLLGQFGLPGLFACPTSPVYGVTFVSAANRLLYSAVYKSDIGKPKLMSELSIVGAAIIQGTVPWVRSEIYNYSFVVNLDSALKPYSLVGDPLFCLVALVLAFWELEPVGSPRLHQFLSRLLASNIKFAGIANGLIQERRMREEGGGEVMFSGKIDNEISDAKYLTLFREWAQGKISFVSALA